MDIVIIIIIFFIFFLLFMGRDIRGFASPLFVIPSLYVLFYFVPYLAQKYVGFEAIKGFDLNDKVVVHTLCFLILWLMAFILGCFLSKKHTQIHSINNLNVTEDKIWILIKYIFFINLIGTILVIWAETRFHDFFTGFRAYKIAKMQSAIQMSSMDRGMIMLGMIMALFSVLGAGYLKGANIKSQRQIVFLHISILPYVVYLFASLSRGFILPYGILYFVGLLLKRKIVIRDIMHIFLVAFIILGSAGIISKFRGEHSEGGISSITKFTDFSLDISKYLEPMNGLQTMVWATEFKKEDPDIINGLILIALHLSPIPSFIINDDGIDLSGEMGVGLSVGIPMPAIGEVDSRLGYCGLWIPLLFGCICGNVWERILYSKSRVFYVLLYFMLINFVVIGAHSNLRAATRGIVWIVGAKLIVDTIKALRNRWKIEF